MSLSIAELDQMHVDNAERLFGRLCFHVKVFKDGVDRPITDYYFQKNTVEEAKEKFKEFRDKQYRDYESMALWLAEPDNKNADSIEFNDITKLSVL